MIRIRTIHGETMEYPGLSRRFDNGKRYAAVATYVVDGEPSAPIYLDGGIGETEVRNFLKDEEDGVVENVVVWKFDYDLNLNSPVCFRPLTEKFDIWLQEVFWSDEVLDTLEDRRALQFEWQLRHRYLDQDRRDPKYAPVFFAKILASVGSRSQDFDLFEYPGGEIAYYCPEDDTVYISLRKFTRENLIIELEAVFN